ncbi:mitochondrial ribosome-associated GTPase 2-like [Antedon mediterranea]|uniref:mitochondrial ribosome-associated GTPase 2-like n=1 Tax=Antedon mediterranea TaxID=105859 RepID=UPI003AF717C2
MLLHIVHIGNFGMFAFYPAVMSYFKQLNCKSTRWCTLIRIFKKRGIREHDHISIDYTLRRYFSKKPKLTEKKLTKKFIDWRKVVFIGGEGGDGCISMRREAHVEFGGPDGGNGGNGAKVIVRSSKKIKSLDKVVSTYKGENGVRGSSSNSHGKNATHTIVEVPVGTMIKENDVCLVDLEHDGDEFIAARGGAGGKGNREFLSNENRAPTIATRGMRGEQRILELELRVMAQFGLIGFPNAGKSTLLRALSRARPAVAAYPFTTLNPHVGMVEYDDMEQIAVADIPGLIQGAHLNKGLGHSFLRHIERCLCLLYVIDLSQPNTLEQLQHLKYELDQYLPGLAERPHAVVGNKIDIPEAKQNLKIIQENISLPVIAISAHYNLHIPELKKHLRELSNKYVNKLEETSEEHHII